MPTALDEDGLQGPVRTVRIQTVRLERQLGNAGATTRLVQSVTYDPEGRRVETIAITPDGSRVKRTFSETPTADGGRSVEMVVLN